MASLSVAPNKDEVKDSERQNEGTQVENEQENQFESLIHVSY
jgi:hypothetical protein